MDSEAAIGLEHFSGGLDQGWYGGAEGQGKDSQSMDSDAAIGLDHFSGGLDQGWYGRTECQGNEARVWILKQQQDQIIVPVAQIKDGMGGLNAKEMVARVWILRQQQDYLPIPVAQIRVCMEGLMLLKCQGNDSQSMVSVATI